MHRRVRPHGRVLAIASLLLGCNPRAPEGDELPPPKAGRESPMLAGEWTEHTSKACRFATQLPTSPSAQPTPTGLLDQIAVEDNVLHMALLASCGDVSSVSSPQQFLDVTSQVIARQLHARVDQTTAIELQGRPGLELAMTIPAADRPVGIFWPGDLSYRLRLYVAGRRQYQLHALHAASATVDDLEARFFAGFRLLDDAPAADAPLSWATHTIEGVTVEAPGTAIPIDSDSPELVRAVRFASKDRSTPYALSVWAAELPGEVSEPPKQLRMHFMFRVATEHTQIISESPVQIAGRPGLEIRYRPNTPLPEHLAPTDAKTREAVQDLMKREPSVFRMRLVSTGDHIVQLLVASATAEDEPERFLDSLMVL